METLALLHANCERICAEKREVEEQFLRDRLRVPENALSKSYSLYPGCGETATATLALTSVENDRGHNEVLYLQETLAIVATILAKDLHVDGFEVVVTERPASQCMCNHAVE